MYINYLYGDVNNTSTLRYICDYIQNDDNTKNTKINDVKFKDTEIALDFSPYKFIICVYKQYIVVDCLQLNIKINSMLSELFGFFYQYNNTLQLLSKKTCISNDDMNHNTDKTTKNVFVKPCVFFKNYDLLTRTQQNILLNYIIDNEINQILRENNIFIIQNPLQIDIHILTQSIHTLYNNKLRTDLLNIEYIKLIDKHNKTEIKDEMNVITTHTYQIIIDEILSLFSPTLKFQKNLYTLLHNIIDITWDYTLFSKLWRDKIIQTIIEHKADFNIQDITKIYILESKFLSNINNDIKSNIFVIQNYIFDTYKMINDK